MSVQNPPKALLTDVFGTVVDWRSTVTNFLVKEAQEALNNSASSVASTVRTSAANIDWGEFSQHWRSSYGQFTTTYDPDKQSFKSVDQHHLESLIILLERHGLTGLWTEDEVQRISMIWHFLEPWSDSPAGLGMLNHKFQTATLSNGNTSLLADLAVYAKLPYAHLISAEDFKAYKPNPKVYNGAADKLKLSTSQCALVAAHLGDLKAAKGCGYQTIYIERAQEEAWSTEQIGEAKDSGWVDMWISLGEGGFKEIARRFGCSLPEQGIYHETLSDGTRRGPANDVPRETSVETQAEKGTYHEDPNVMN